MSMFNLVALWLGYAVMAAGGLLTAYIAKEFAVGFARACSRTRFYMAVARKNSMDLPPMKFPKFFLNQWWHLTGARSTIQGPGGYWNGVGDWKAHKQAEKSKESA